MALAAPPTTRALRRVVVTGIGCVSPVGATAPETWAGVLAGASNARRLTFGGREYLAAPAHEAAAIPRARDRSRFINLAVAAAAEAVADAGPAALAVAPERRGVCVASGIGSLGDAVGAAASLAAGRKLSPYFVPRLLANMAAGAVAVDHGCRGPLTTSAAACAAGAMSIGEAYRLVEAGRADVVLCGGAESTVDDRAAKESEIPNFKGSDLGRSPLVSADFWPSDHLSERSRSMYAFSGTRSRGTLMLKRT